MERKAELEAEEDLQPNHAKTASLAEDTANEANLFFLLFMVALVNANSVRPQM